MLLLQLILSLPYVHAWTITAVTLDSTQTLSLLYLPWYDILQGGHNTSNDCHYSLAVYVRAQVCVWVWNCLECFTVPCGKCTGCDGWQAAVTPFPPDAFPVPSMITVVQPLWPMLYAHRQQRIRKVHKAIFYISQPNKVLKLRSKLEN